MRFLRRSGRVAIAAFMLNLILSLAHTAQAAPGDLDSSFGNGGKVTTDFLGKEDGAAAVAIQADGKIVVAGAIILGSTHDFGVTRYNTDGSLDSSFGSGGKAATDFSEGSIFAADLAIQPDGKIIVVGGNSSNTIAEFILVRYNSNGSLDSSFGSGGRVRTDFDNNRDSASAVLILPDGHIIVAGVATIRFTGNDFALARYNSNGSLDTAWGNGGRVTAHIFGLNDIVSSAVLQPDGKIIVAGFTSTDNGMVPLPNFDFVLTRFNADGSLDSTFGSGGRMITDFFGFDDKAADVALQADGKILLAGYAQDKSGGFDFALARYDDSDLDSTFGNGGKVTTDFVGLNDFASDLVVQPNGKIVVVGYNFGSGDSNFYLARYNSSDGSLDSTFGSGGKVITDFGGMSDDRAFGVALQPDGKIVAAGMSIPSGSDITGSNFAVARYLGATPPGAQVQFSASAYSAGEGNHSAQITVTRTGDLSGTSTVNYATIDNSASQKSDYIVAVGTLTFNAGQTSKTFNVLLVDDLYVETPETINLLLSSPGGAMTGTQSTAVLTINDNDTLTPTTNLLDEAQFFVRQHYLDFLNREPDAAGLAYWTNEISICGADAACVNRRRVAVSAAFFVEAEFQNAGFFVYRVRRAALGLQPTYEQYVFDRNLIGAGTDAEKTAFATLFVQRPEFIARYGQSSTCSNLSDALITTVKENSAVDLTPHRSELIAECDANPTDTVTQRARVIRKLIEYPEFIQAEFNPAFVLTEYFGYLRRNADPGGYAFWLNVLNSRAQGNYQAMVCAFITSTEYQARFSPVITRANSDCANISASNGP